MQIPFSEGQASAEISWGKLSPVAEAAFTGAVRKWCDPDEISLLAQDHLIRDALKKLRDGFCKIQKAVTELPKSHTHTHR